ncbi:MAG: hypothetical protein LBC92_03905 [Rickettsiales bacterium]|jgi:hypothetical protein|nr:hypothetical protein [Rickettsiales bacterium]
MYEYNEYGKEKKSISKKEKDEVINFIVELWRQNDVVRDEQKRRYDLLKREILLQGQKYSEYMNSLNKNQFDTTKEDEWESELKLYKLFMFFENRQSELWENIHRNFSENLNVISMQDRNKAVLKKQYILQKLYEGDFEFEFDKSLREHLDLTGEMCFQLKMKENFKKMKIQPDEVDVKNDRVIRETLEYILVERKTKEVAFIQAIHPLDVVWDKDVNPQCNKNLEQWNNTPKIIRSYATIREIISNKLYKLSKEDIDELKEKYSFISENRENDDRSVDNYRTANDDDNKNIDLIEIKTLYGNIQIEDEFYENVVAIVIDNKYLAYFKNNPYDINPIINFALLRDPNNNRGIPLLWSIFDLCMLEEYWMNRSKDITELEMSPPIIAPTGLFKNNRLKMSPRTIYYVNKELGFDPNTDIYKFEVSNSMNIDTKIPAIDQYQKNISGIDPNNKDQLPQGERITAEQIKATINGNGGRLARDIDYIKKYCIIPLLRSFSEFLELIKFNEEEEINNSLINNAIRSLDVEFNFATSDTIEQQKTNLRSIMDLLNAIMQTPVAPTISNELFITLFSEAMSLYGFANIQQFLTQTPPAQIQSILDSLGENEQQELLQVIQNFSQQKQLEKMEEEYQEKAMELSKKAELRKFARQDLQRKEIEELQQELQQNPQLLQEINAYLPEQLETQKKKIARQIAAAELKTNQGNFN